MHIVTMFAVFWRVSYSSFTCHPLPHTNLSTLIFSRVVLLFQNLSYYYRICKRLNLSLTISSGYRNNNLQIVTFFSTGSSSPKKKKLFQTLAKFLCKVSLTYYTLQILLKTKTILKIKYNKQFTYPCGPLAPCGQEHIYHHLWVTGSQHST